MVSDNGCGIADGDLADVFFRYKRRQALPVPGEVGMGLSVARKIADLYGGRILLESQPGTRAPASRCVCPSGRPGTPWYT